MIVLLVKYYYSEGTMREGDMHTVFFWWTWRKQAT